MSDTGSDSEVVIELAEEFIDRYRRGERPALTEYTSKYPELAAQILDVFPAMAMMENVAIYDAESDGGGVSSVDGRTAQPPSIGDFRVLREVGRGGMGIVYEAEQLSLGRRVALKVLLQQMLLDKKHKRRFEREAKAAARLHHTNIVPVFGVGEQDGLHYYVMQFIQGLGLDDVIQELRRLKETPSSAQEGSDLNRESASDGSARRVAYSLMTGQFERTVITRDDSDVDDAEVAGTAAVDRPEVHQSGHGALQLSMSAAGLSDSSSLNVSESLHLTAENAPSGQSDGPTSPGSSARRKQTFWTSVAHIGQQVASALQYAHEQGITHRDIKPSNLLLDMRGTVWVTDFGLAKATDQQDITQTGDILGTLRYMPPEAFEGKSGPSGDLYALGLTLYELLAQKPAFEEKDRHKLIKLVTTGEPQRIEKLNPDVPRDLATIVHKAIDRDPGRRYQTAGEFEDDLQRFLDDEPIKARRMSVAERVVRWSRRNKSLAVIAALLLIINITPVLVWQLIISNSNLEEALKLAKAEAEAARQLAEDNKALAADNRRAMYLTAMLTTQRALDQKAKQPARDILDGMRPRPGEVDLRGWEWYFLSAKVRGQPQIRTRKLAIPGATTENDSVDNASNEQHIVALALSRDSSQLATAGFDGTIQIWDLATGQNLNSFERQNAAVRSLDWNPDGTRLVSCGDECVIQIWDTTTGQVLQTIDATHGRQVYAVAWSPNGRYIASAGDDRTLRIFDVKTEEEVHTFDLTLGTNFRALDWSRDEQRLAAASDTGEVIVWDIAAHRRFAQFSKGNQALFTVRFSHDGTKLSAGGGRESEESTSGDARSGTITIWDLNTKEELHRLDGYFGAVHSLDWSADGERLISAGDGGRIVLWDTVLGAQLLAIPNLGKSDAIATQFGPGELQIVSADPSTVIRLFDATPSYAEELSEKLLPTLDARIAENATFDDLKLRGKILTRLGRWDEATRCFDQAFALARGETSQKVDGWFTSPWWVVGPYPEPLDAAQPPESHLDTSAPVPAARTNGVAESLHWESVVLEPSQSLKLERLFHQAGQISGYAQMRIYSHGEQHVGVIIDRGDHVRLWFNGKLIHSGPEPVPRAWGSEVVDVTLLPGWNTLLAKISSSADDRGLTLQVRDDPRQMGYLFASNEKWAEALAWYDRAYSQHPDDLNVLVRRGRAALAAGQRDVAEQSFDAVLAQKEPSAVREVALSYVQHAQSLITSGKTHEAPDVLAKAREWYEILMSGDGARDGDAISLASILQTDSTDWSVLKPIAMTSSGGATLTRQKDGSILASGENPTGDVYTIRAAVDIPEIRAILLEALSDPSFPKLGPGRHDPSGNFQLNTIRVYGGIDDNGEPIDRLSVADACASFEFNQNGNGSVLGTIRDGDQRFWHVFGRAGERHTAIFKLATPRRVQPGQTLIVQLAHTDCEKAVNLGRFRVSVTDDPNAFDMNARRFAVSKIEDPKERLGAAYAALGDASQAVKWYTRALNGKTDFGTRLALIEQIVTLQPNLRDVEALRPNDPVFEWLRWCRRFRESGDTTNEKQLVAEFSQFLERTTEIDLRMLYGVPEFRSVIDTDRFEVMLEQQLAQSAAAVCEQIWAKKAALQEYEKIAFRQTKKSLSDLIAKLDSEGLRPVNLSAIQLSNLREQFFVTWTKDDKQYRIKLELTRQQLDDLLTTLPKEMQLVSLEENGDGTWARYAALWVKQTTPAPWELHERLDTSETLKLAATMHDRGIRPMYVNAYPDGTFTTIWAQDGGESELLLGLTHQDLMKLEQERASDCLPIWIDSYFDGRRRRYCMIIDNGIKNVEWKFTLLERENEFESVIDRNYQGGWSLVATTWSPVGPAPGKAD